MPKFVPRQRKHKVRQRSEKDSRSNKGKELTEGDANASEIISVNEKEQKRQDIKLALKSQQPKISGKKQKRLDKYIDKKLQKEENLELIKKLASTKIDTSLLRSARSLGVHQSKREVLTQALNEVRKGVNLKSNEDLLYEDRDTASETSDYADYVSDLHSVSAARYAAPSVNKNVAPVIQLGSGLKRPLDPDSTGNPTITKRRRRTSAKIQPEQQLELPWEGFSSDGDSELTQSFPSDSASTGSQTKSEFPDSDGSDPSEEEGSTDGSNSSLELDEAEKRDRQERSSAFKAWATHQINESMGFKPTGTANDTRQTNGIPSQLKLEKPAKEPRTPEQDPLPPELQVNNVVDRSVHNVNVDRTPEIQDARLNLPIVAEEQRIMEAIHNNPTVVICGATGSGKTTQVPQFLYEAGYGSPDGPNPGIIGVTQPRRVAAISMANRVSEELGSPKDIVSHQVRFESSVSIRTSIKFMTDGILMREVAHDFALVKYSIIIIDEAHERSVNTDILIGMLSRIVALRSKMSKENADIKPLKLVIMSATLRISDFLSNPILFRDGAPPLLQIEGRQYPVTTHFARRTQRDYIDEVFDKVCNGHQKLPPGGMLVFLTGQNEITALEKRLKATLADSQGPYSTRYQVRAAADEMPLEVEDMAIGDEVLAINGFVEDEEEEEDDLFDHDAEGEFEVDGSEQASSGVHVLPLYSQLQAKDQLRVFKPPPENTRMIILATNVAETSLTIPGIRYVFDTGRAKEKKYDRVTGVQSFEIGWISKASADQRTGRAGRTGPGHCYRLYSSAVYERDFEEHAEPEILRMPVEGVVLQLKSMDLQHVVNFPFPTPPDRQSLAKAEKLLSYLGAISPEGRITEIGRELSYYPLSPRFSKMLTIGHQQGCMSYTIALVAALATPNLFIPENQLPLSAPAESDVYTNEDRLAEEARTKLRSSYNHAHHLLSQRSTTSDALKALTALCAYSDADRKEALCKDMFLSGKSLNEASNLRQQLINIIHNNDPTLVPSKTIPKLPPPSKIQSSALQQITAAAFIDQIAILHSAHPSPPELPRKPNRAIDVPYLPLFPITTTRKADTELVDIAIFIHPSSILAHTSVKDLPTYIVYSHLQRSAPSTIEGVKRPKTRMHALGSVSGKQIAALARGTPLLQYGKPIGTIEEVDSKTRRCWVIPSLVGEKGGLGWPLPAQKVVQRRDGRGEWRVEEVIG